MNFQQNFDIENLYDEIYLKGVQKKRISRRIKFLKFVFFILFLGILSKLVLVQIIEKNKYQHIAKKIHTKKTILPAERGNIYDRNGQILVSNTLTSFLSASPNKFSDNLIERKNITAKISEKLSKILKVKNEKIFSLLKPNASYMRFEKIANVYMIEAIENDPLLAKYIVRENKKYKRNYHFQHLASQLIGVLDTSGKGIYGIEKKYDSLLKGQNGEKILNKIGTYIEQNRIENIYISPIKGNHIKLTIDSRIQSIAEKELENSVKKHNADMGIVLISDVKTGELLTVAQYPFVNLNKITKSDVRELKLHSISDMYEPGSIFKLLTTVAAFEYSVAFPDEIFTAGKSYLPNGRKKPIFDSHVKQTHTFRSAFEESSNIVMAKIGERVGKEKFYITAKKIGFGTPTGIELPKESEGYLKKPVYWSDATLPTISFGYEVMVTPLQILMAYSAIANDGVLLQPSIVKEMISPNGEIIFSNKTSVVRRACSSTTANIVKEFLHGVVERGTAKSLNIKSNIELCGKTGTAEKNINGHIVKNQHLTTFAGFFPKSSPQYAIVVIIDNPKNGEKFASQTAAPVCKDIIEKICAVLGNPVQTNNSEIHFTKSENNNSRKETILDTNQNIVDTVGKIFVPNFVGKSILGAMKKIKEIGLNYELEGEKSGIVFKQTPESLSYVNPNSIIKIFCRSEKLASK